MSAANERRIDTKVVENIEAGLALEGRADRRLSRDHLVLERVTRALGGRALDERPRER